MTRTTEGSTASTANTHAVGRRAGVFALALALLLLALVAREADGGFTAAISGNGSAATGVLALSDTVSGTSCAAVGTATANQTCSTSLAPSSVTTSATTTTASVKNPGTLGEQVGAQVPSCGLAQAVDTSGNGDTAVAYGGVTYQVAGPLSGEAIGFDGSTAWLGTVNLIPGPQVFTQLAWFKTTGSGSIFSFENSYTTANQSDWDRMIWVDPTGHVVAGVYPGSTQELVSPNAYNNGAWHMAAVTLSSAGFFLYVDGALVALNAGVTSPQVYSGYWHIGWSNARDSWPDAPSSAYFPGSIAGVAVLPTALSAVEVLTLYSSATFSAYSSGVGGYSPSAYWPMQDSGTVPYAGVVPGGGGGTSYPDTSGNANTATPQGGTGAVVASTSGPLGGGSVTLNGTTGWLETTNQYAGPQVFTQLAWFRTTGSGSIFSFEDQQGASASNWDRMIWVDPSGHVVAGVYSGSTQEAVSSGTYNDGKWHLVAVTLSSAGLALYVDGSLVGSNTATTAQAYSGWWHIGWSNAVNGWPDPPTTAYFPGSLAGVGIIPTALSGSEISALYASSTFAAYSSGVLGYSPTSYWALQPAQVQASGAGCAQVEITVQLGSTCLYPSGGCASPSSSGTLAGLASESPTTALAPTSQSTLTLVYEEVSSLPSSLSGAHVVGMISLDGVAGWNVSLSHPMDIEL